MKKTNWKSVLQENSVNVERVSTSATGGAASGWIG